VDVYPIAFVKMFFKCVPCDYEHKFGFFVHSLTIQISCTTGNRTMDATLIQLENIFFVSN